MIQAHNNPYKNRNHNVNSFMHHNLRLFETKPCYVGRNFVVQLPTSLSENSISHY
jgi:hypothetical protein